MTSRVVSNVDRTEIVELISRSCWFGDGGDADGWLSLFTSDAKITGIPNPIEGEEQLRQLPLALYAMGNGKLRHVISNVVVDGEDREDAAIAKACSALYDVRAGAGKLISFSAVQYRVLRQGGSWKISAIHADTLFTSGR